MIKQFLSAFQFLTRIRLSDIPESPGRSMAYFPFVGLILGVGLVFLDLVLPQVFPGMISDVLLVIYLIWITGALHLDGFCDVADGFYAGRSTDEILTVMRDSRIGVMAAVSLFSLLILKIIAIAHLPRPIRYPVILLMPVWSRWAMVWAATLSSYARPGGGLGSGFCDYTDKTTLMRGSWLPVLAALYFFELRGALFLTGSYLLGIYWLIRWINGKIGGMTGDTFGAVCETGEVWFILLAHVFLI